ncbi:hypothetical protein HYH03_011211 [Edaphochlamys debaryana]|uniref:Guanylate cyclase domain-containing protein n=1 Tax=Edaphochlamys debaryana TaxID=47281 RepID=A0A835XUK9_9CHLO|nr:hypothetical protein HYH03_011211 [Edaphochlamys debaryana]|eukprot:KAG2490411.1 hypothetical protein HYH03_011211 [Edaphochlamys debaryana]
MCASRARKVLILVLALGACAAEDTRLTESRVANCSARLRTELRDFAATPNATAREQGVDFAVRSFVEDCLNLDLEPDRASGFVGLDQFIPEDPGLEWSDVVSIPLDGDLFLMYYRRDLFDRYKLPVPVTWEDFADLAERMNGTDTDGDGVGDLYGVCFDNGPPVCKANFLLAALAAPYIQYLGTSQGFFFDPITMKPLFDNAGMRAALELYVRLWRVQDKHVSCEASNPTFHRGRCLMTINWGDEYKANAKAGNGSWGNASWLGVASLPGSTHVLERASGKLVACASTNFCPHAKMTKLASGTNALVNYAPYSAFGGWAAAVSTLAPSPYQQRAYQFFSHVARPAQSWDDVLDPTSSIDPYRTSQLETSGANFQRWINAGYNEAATRLYLAAVRDALEHNNIVLDSRLQFVGLPYRLYFEFALHDLTWNHTTSNATLDSVLAGVEKQLEGGLLAVGDTEALRKQYCKLIGCQVQTPNEHHEDGGLSDGEIAAAVVVPVCFVLLMALLGFLWWRHGKKSQHRLLGGVKPPGPGPMTTLLVTDIESSTTLWELLSEQAMGKAVELHHSVIRRALAKHSGYESATEGDSFICAFHTAAGAVQCALAIQQDLLSASWPQELMACSGSSAAAELFLSPETRQADAVATIVGDFHTASTLQATQGSKSTAPHQNRSSAALRFLKPLMRASLRKEPSGPTVQRCSTSYGNLQSPTPGGAQAVDAAAVEVELYTSGGGGRGATGGGGGLAGLLGGGADSDNFPASPGSGALGRGKLLAAANSLPSANTASVVSANAIASGTTSSHLATSPFNTTNGTGATDNLRNGAGNVSAPLSGSDDALRHAGTGRFGERSTIASLGGEVPRLCLMDLVKAAWLGSSGDANGSSTPGRAQALTNAAVSQLLTIAASLQAPLGRYNTPKRLPTASSSQVMVGAAELKATGAASGPSVLMFRGLRVRIGMASGVPSAHDVNYVSGEARMHYSGPCMRLARAVQDAAAGGQVLLSDSTFAQLRQDPGRLSDAVVILHMGQHKLSERGDDLPPQQVYQAATQKLLGRVTVFPPLKVRSTAAAGVLQAPVGAAAVAFVYTVGAEALLAWDAAVAREALGMLESTFSKEVMRNNQMGAGGYIVEATNGLLLAAFADPALAVASCLTTVTMMPELNWPPALLENALCEELAVDGVDSDGLLVQTVLFRGLRIKAGLDFGSVRASINGATGRAAYRGRVMNRAARIAASASSGQVLCSRDLWQFASGPAALLPQPITGISTGTATLKGVPEPLELLVCRPAFVGATESQMGPSMHRSSINIGMRSRRSSTMGITLLQGHVSTMSQPQQAALADPADGAPAERGSRGSRPTP